MIVQSYNFSLKYDIIMATSGKLIGDSTSLIGYTSIGSILLFQNNTSNFLNVKREFKSLGVINQCLVMASENTLTVHDVENNFDQCFIEVQDGINTLAIGQYYNGDSLQELIFVGGNCSLQGFNVQGEEIYWNVASDEVAALCVFGFDNENYIVIGTTDNCVRLLRGVDIVFQFNTQSLPVSFAGIIYFDQTYLLTGMENGSIKLHRQQLELWHNSEDQEKIFKLICNDENHFIVGRRNGQIELRSLMTGQLIQKLNLDEQLSGMLYSDLRGVGVNQIIAISKQGNVRGYTVVDKDADNLNLSQSRILTELTQKKQELMQQMQLDKMPVGLDLRCGFQKNYTNQCLNLVFILSEPGYYITQAIIFHDTYYKEGYIVNNPQPSDKLFAPLKQLVDNQKVILNCKVFVSSNPHGNYFLILETSPTFPKFANFQYVEQDLKISSFVEAKINERVPRYVKWIDQCFNINEEVKKKFESTNEFIFNTINIINQQKLQIHFDSKEGKVTIRCDSIATCGDIIQDLCDFIQIQDLMTVGQFPVEMQEFKKVLEAVQQHKSSKLQISGDVAEAMNLVKSYIVKAEDSRMIGDIRTMQKMYANVMVQNKAIQSELYKKKQNNDILMNNLKEVNAMISNASQLRVGNAKIAITNMCRNAVKKNNLLTLIEVIQQGREI
uniref:BBS2, putative n=1 Tax=Paramecium tetraurelia TaxID=5888 RepID=Q3SE78_PARTE|nr:BBS2, putative [Paramecium tetraurelia]